MSCFIISDLHLSHKNIGNFRSFVKDSQENTELIKRAWEETIRKNDIVFVLGDATFDKEGLDVLGNLKGRKILVSGNHDNLISLEEKASVFEEIHGMLRYKKLWLTHCPIHPQEMRKCVGNAHGHTHDVEVMTKTWYVRPIPDKRYLNCCVDAIYKKTGRFFYTLDQVKSYFGILK